MSESIPIIVSVIGLVAKSADIAIFTKQLYDSGKNALTSIRRISEEMDQLHFIFSQVQMLLEGHVGSTSRSRLTMIPLHYLMTILSGCVLVYSRLDKRLMEAASVTTGPAGLGAEAGIILTELERHKSSLHTMLTIIQCNSTKEAAQQLASLREQVEEISEQILESHNEVAVQLRELISRHHDDTSDVSICHTTHTQCLSSFRTTSTAISRATIRTTSSSLSLRSDQPLYLSWGEELKNSGPYKQRWRQGDASSSSTGLSKASRATKGDTWSILSDMTLGDLSISEISALELPISLLDLYDPTPYQQSTRRKQARRGVKWSSRGRLHRAIRGGNTFKFRTLLNLGADPEETNADGPLLVYAAKKSDGVTFCRLLLDRGVQVDARDCSGRTPLSHCASLPNDFVCKLLLDRGAQVDTRDCSRRTPLSHCAGLGNYSVCKMLLRRGAAVDATDSNGRTPLSYCAELGNSFVCKLLLDGGASVDSIDSNKRTPLLHCAQLGINASACRLLLDRGATVDTTDSTGRTPLSHCAELGDVSVCKLLLDQGAAVNSTDSNGRTPLSYCAARGDLAIAGDLLKRGATAGVRDLNCYTPLQYAHRWGEASEIYQLLLNSGSWHSGCTCM